MIMSRSCCICGKTLGFFSFEINLRDGFICDKCAKACGIRSYEFGKSISATQIKEVFDSRVKALKSFKVTNTFSMVELDSKTHSFKVNGDYFQYSELESFSYFEDPNSSQFIPQDGKTSGATIGGVIGGIGGSIIGGAVGTAVGGKIGSLFSTTCKYMYIDINLRSILGSNMRLHFIKEKLGHHLVNIERRRKRPTIV